MMRDRQATNAVLDRWLRWFFVGSVLAMALGLGALAYVDAATRHHDTPIAWCARHDSIAGRPMPPDTTGGRDSQCRSKNRRISH